MNYEQAKELGKRETKNVGKGKGPKSAHSVNRLNAIANTVAIKYGDKAAKEFHKEMTSR
jgi:hypothetical protein